jgi:Protein of unknown function (DUF4058)
MPLRDHFRSPLDDVHSWDGLHAMWPAVMVQQLVRILPERYFAMPGVYLGSLFEVDIGTFEDADTEPSAANSADSGLAVATYAPPKPTVTFEAQLPSQDVYEVRIYHGQRKRKLVAAIEIVSPSNKDRPDRRSDFVTKVAGLLKNGICVSIVDIVSTMDFNLYADLLTGVHGFDPTLGEEPAPMYAVTLRARYEARKKLLDTWYHPLAIGQSLPTLPIWLNEKLPISLDLESSYEETCRTLRIR